MGTGPALGEYLQYSKSKVTAQVLIFLLFILSLFKVMKK